MKPLYVQMLSATHLLEIVVADPQSLDTSQLAYRHLCSYHNMRASMLRFTEVL